MKSLKDFKKFELVKTETFKGGGNVGVDVTHANGWYSKGISTDPGASGGEWDWIDRGSGWACSTSSCCDCNAVA